MKGISEPHNINTIFHTHFPFPHSVFYTNHSEENLECLCMMRSTISQVGYR